MHALTNMNTFHFTVVLVNFTADSYRADVNATSVSISVMAFGSFDSQFIVEVVPDRAHLPKGGT